jgi:hypothetical protein
MLIPSLPRSLADLLVVFRPCFTAPTYQTFSALVAGLLAQPGPRTVTGMLVGARLAGRWPHSRAHRFFSAARWQPDVLGLVLLDLLVDLLVAADAPLLLVVDDTLFRRSGRKVFGAAWHHDPLARGKVAWGNNWVVVGCWSACRSCPSARCACRSWRGCGGPSSRAAPSSPSPWSWWAWSPDAAPTDPFT